MISGEGHSTHPAREPVNCLCHPLEYQTRVVATETEAVLENVIDRTRPGLTRNVIEITIGVGVVEIDRGRNDLVLQRHHAGSHFDSPGGPQQVPQLALAAGDTEGTSMVSED